MSHPRQPSRITRISTSLELLPCELHDSVLHDLEFHQLIQLSRTAGPRLTWSLSHSPSPWSKFFIAASNDNDDDDDDAKFGPKTWSDLLALSDTIKYRCYGLPKEKGTRKYEWDYVPLSFLHYTSANEEWKGSGIKDGEALFNRWVCSLNEAVLTRTWRAFHTDYHSHIKPWLPHVTDIARAVFEKVPHVGRAKKRTFGYQEGAAIRTAFALEELVVFCDAYQTLREKRARALAAELDRLAGLYVAYPDVLKMPFAPQTRRRNTQHVPNQMRCEARKLVRRAEKCYWDDGSRYVSRFAYPFPGIVSYEWCHRFSDQVLKDVEHMEPADGLEGYEMVIEKPPWVKLDEKARLETGMDLKADLSKVFRRRLLDPKTTTYKVKALNGRESYTPHAEAELVWLESFAESMASLEHKDVEAARDAKGEGWDAERPRSKKRDLEIRLKKRDDKAEEETVERSR